MKQLLGVAPLAGSLIAALALGLLILTACPYTATAQESDTERVYNIAKGKTTYRIYCINCHGPAAKGDGELAELLTVKPTDLTILAQENEGVYPEEWVRKIIDGREKVRGHGMKEMPVWGYVFQVSGFAPQDESYDREARAKMKVNELVVYLESIQLTTEGTAESGSR